MTQTNETKTQSKGNGKATERPRSSLLDYVDQLIEQDRRHREETQQPKATRRDSRKVEPEAPQQEDKWAELQGVHEVVAVEPDSLATTEGVPLEDVLSEPQPAEALDQQEVDQKVDTQPQEQPQVPPQEQPREQPQVAPRAEPSFGGGATVWQAMAKRRLDPEDPDAFDAMPVILDVPLRLIAGEREYVLQMRKDDGRWSRVFSGYEPSSALIGLGYFGLRVLSDDLARINALPKLRPAEAARRQRELYNMRMRGLGGHDMPAAR